MIDALIDLAIAREAPEDDPAKYVAADRTISRALHRLFRVFEVVESRMPDYPELAGTFIDHGEVDGR